MHKAGDMTKRIVHKEDGRQLIYYSFDAADIASANDSKTDAASVVVKDGTTLSTKEEK